MSTTIIQIVDNGANCKYKLSPSTNMLGRRYDNNADFIQVQFPEVEIQSDTTCTMMVEDLQGNVLDHIEVKNNELTPIYNNISQNISVNIGFYFSGDNNYIKNSEYQLFRFCDALKPDGFVPVTPVQSGNIDKLIQQGVIDVRWKEGTNNVLEIVRLDSKNNTELELSPFVQEQSDLAETDTSSETFVKNKSTKYLENEGDDGSSPYATEKYVDEHSVSADAVLYTPQTLTEEQQAQARTNIGVTGGEPIAEAIRDNTTQIVPTSGGLKIGGALNTAHNTDIAIGNNAQVQYSNFGAIAIGSGAVVNSPGGDGTAIGAKSKAGSSAIGLGFGAAANAAECVQIGYGGNNTAKTVKIWGDTIYNWATHTATFQNLQIDGVDEYPTLSGADAPTTTTVGKVKQFYVETTTPTLYYCSSITGTGTTEDPYVYNWTQAGGADEELRNNTVQIKGIDGSFLAGGVKTESSRLFSDSIGIGDEVRVNAPSAVVLGYQASVASGGYTGHVAIGYLARTDKNATGVIQVGTGTNSTAKSFQINDDNIYKTDTHTLTVQNIEQNRNPVYGILFGDADPTTETVGKQFQFYVNTTSKKLFQCMAVTTTTEEPITTTYEWQTVGDETLAKQIQNNEVQIINANGGLQLGNSNTESDGIAIGQNARAKNVASLALGYGSDANISSASGVYTAIGYNAKTSGVNSIQLGSGTNSQNNTLQIYKDNIYNHNTHTLTVQNAQVNGTNVYGVLQGETDPTESTVGAVGQFYLNTASKALWQCVVITTTTDATTYTWQQVGGSSEKKYLHNLQISGIPHIKYFNIYIDIINNISTNYQTLTNIINDLKNIFGSDSIDANGYVDIYSAKYANVFKISISDNNTLIISYIYTIVDSANLKINNIADTCVRLARPDTGVLKLTSTEFEQCTVIDTVVEL